MHHQNLGCSACILRLKTFGAVQFEEKHHSGLLQMVADQLKCTVSDIVDFELNVCDTQDGVIGGVQDADVCKLLSVCLCTCLMS